MKLSTEQITHLKNKIEKKGFKYYDVQAEILDNMASSIEAKMTENPQLSVDQAYDITYSDLGIFAFSEFEESIVKKIRTELYNSFWSNLKILFTSMKIIIPSLIFTLFYLLREAYQDHFRNIYYISIITIPAIICIVWLLIYSKNKFLKHFLVFKIVLGAHFSIFYLMLFTHHFIFHNFILLFLLSIYLIIHMVLLTTGRLILSRTSEFHQLYNLAK